MRRRVVWILVLMLAMGVALGGCATGKSNSGGENPAGSGTNSGAGSTDTGGGTDAPAQPKAGGTLTIGVEKDPSRLDSVNSPWMDDAIISVYERLVALDHDGNIVGQLAESWDLSADGKTITFKLKPGKTFHNGEPVNATAVKEFLDVLYMPEGGHPWRTVYYSGVQSVEAVDEHTVVVHMNYRFNHIMDALSYTYASIVPMAVRKELGDDYGKNVVVGSGPFKFESWTPGHEVVLIKNPDYSDPSPFIQNQGPPYLDKVVFRYIPEEAQRAIEIETGNVDVIRAPAYQDVQRLEADPDLEVIRLPQWSVVLFEFNTTRKPWDDRRVRQAFAYAINRQAIVDTVLYGNGVVARSPVMAQDPVYWSGAESYYDYNQDKARQLLQEAGYTFNGSAWMKDGQALKGTLLIYTDSLSKNQAQLMQAQLGQIGIQLEIEAVDRATHFGRLYAADVDMYIFPYLWDDTADVVKILKDPRNIGNGGSNWSNFDNPELARLFKELDTAETLEQRQALFADAQKIMLDEATPIPLYTPDNVWVVNRKVQNFKPYLWSLYPYLNDVWMNQ